MKLAELDRLEDELIIKYKETLGKIVKKLSNREFKNMLLQRRWTSYSFTVLYDFGIDSIINEKAKNVLREIRNDEYPHGKPSHREDLMHDLTMIGIDREEIINTEPSKETNKIIQHQIEMLRIKEDDEMHDIKTVTFLRFALEVLASVEYGVFVQRLEDFGLNKKNSKFYWSHYLHDMKQEPLGKKGNTHSDVIADVLVEMLDTIKKVNLCSKTEEKSYELRLNFFDQKF